MFNRCQVAGPCHASYIQKGLQYVKVATRLMTMMYRQCISWLIYILNGFRAADLMARETVLKRQFLVGNRIALHPGTS